MNNAMIARLARGAAEKQGIKLDSHKPIKKIFFENGHFSVLLNPAPANIEIKFNFSPEAGGPGL